MIDRTSWRWIKPVAALVSVALAIAAVPHDGRTSVASAVDLDHRAASGGGPPLLDWPVVSPRTLVSML